MKMKNVIYAALVVAVLASCDVIPEDNRTIEVPLQPSERVVLLNEFTGWQCVNCPDAAVVATKLTELVPENVIVVGMHPDGHGFTAPIDGVQDADGVEYDSPDFCSKEAMDYLTSYGGSISTGLPAGVINGRKFDDTYIQLHAKWNAQVLAQRAIAPDCLIALEHGIEGENHKVVATLTPKTDMAYNVSLQMWLVESGIHGLQRTHGGINFDYTHNHVFRHCINALWGDELGAIKEQTTKEYTFAIDAEYVVDNCSVVAVLINTETHEVIQAGEIALGNGAH